MNNNGAARKNCIKDYEWVFFYDESFYLFVPLFQGLKKYIFSLLKEFDHDVFW